MYVTTSTHSVYVRVIRLLSREAGGSGMTQRRHIRSSHWPTNRRSLRQPRLQRNHPGVEVDDRREVKCIGSERDGEEIPSLGSVPEQLSTGTVPDSSELPVEKA
jgi:hypothetical protein